MKKYMIVAIASVLSMTQVQAKQRFELFNATGSEYFINLWQIENRKAVKELVKHGSVRPGKRFSLDIETEKCSLVLTIMSGPFYGSSVSWDSRYYLSGSAGNDFFVAITSNPWRLIAQPNKANNVSGFIDLGNSQAGHINNPINIGDDAEKMRLSK